MCVRWILEAQSASQSPQLHPFLQWHVPLLKSLLHFVLPTLELQQTQHGVRLNNSIVMSQYPNDHRNLIDFYEYALNRAHTCRVKL